MPIPTFDELMLPVLKLCAVQTWLMRDLVGRLSDDFKLTLNEQEQMIPSGSLTVMASRTHWAKTYLKQAGLVEQPKRAYVSISAQGRELLSTKPLKIDTKLLKSYPEFLAFIGGVRSDDHKITNAPLSMTVAQSINTEASSRTPEEQIASAYSTLDETLRDALLARILDSTPAFFERLIIDLLISMGYGGSRADAGEQLGGTGDGGVDGVIREDQLGLDRVYLQAKRYKPGNSIGSEAVQAFIGALVGRGAQKGVFITTSSFTKSALDAANRSGGLRLVLVDGDELTKFMVRFGVGVRTVRTVEIKDVDPLYFRAFEPE